MKLQLRHWLSLLLIVVAAPLLAQTVPPAINYQGRLTDDQGTPLPSGEYTIALRVWSDATAASTAEPNYLVWGRERSVTVINGTFNVILDDSGSPVSGAAVTQVAEAFRGPARFLGLTIVRTPSGTLPLPQRKEMLPRQQILTSPFALQADRAALAADVVQEVRDALTPPGTVIAWMGTNSIAPAGWEFCWGQEVSRSDPRYARLFTVLGTSNGAGDGSTTYHLPDLRGLFLRGVDTDGVNDPDNQSRTNRSGVIGPAVGSLQSDDFRSHNHRVEGDNSALQGGDYIVKGSPGGHGLAIRPTENTGGKETRPRNAYVHYLIKL